MIPVFSRHRLSLFLCHIIKSSSRPTLKSRQVAAKPIAHSTGLRVIAFESHTVWYGARPIDRTTHGPITVSRGLVSSLGFSVEAPLLYTSHSTLLYPTLLIYPRRQSHVDLQQLNYTALLQSYGCPPLSVPLAPPVECLDTPITPYPYQH